MLSLAQYLRQRRKLRENLTAMAALIETPADLGDGVQLPAGAELALSYSSVLATATVLIEANDRSIGLQAGAANAKHTIGWFEKGVTLTKAGGVAGVVSVYVRDGFGVARLIAEG